MSEEIEIWKVIPGFDNYSVSNLGNVKNNKRNRLLSLQKDHDGYLYANLYKEGKIFRRKANQYVAMAFLGHKTCGLKLVVNHKDFDRSNNKLSNLEIVTQRQNANQKHLRSTSKYTGVSWSKVVNKWHAQIIVDKKRIHLGYYEDELKASEAYENYLSNLKN